MSQATMIESWISSYVQDPLFTNNVTKSFRHNGHTYLFWLRNISAALQIVYTHAASISGLTSSVRSSLVSGPSAMPHFALKLNSATSKVGIIVPYNYSFSNVWVRFATIDGAGELTWDMALYNIESSMAWSTTIFPKIISLPSNAWVVMYRIKSSSNYITRARVSTYTTPLNDSDWGLDIDKYITTSGTYASKGNFNLCSVGLTGDKWVAIYENIATGILEWVLYDYRTEITSGSTGIQLDPVGWAFPGGAYGYRFSNMEKNPVTGNAHIIISTTSNQLIELIFDKDFYTWSTNVIDNINTSNLKTVLHINSTGNRNIIAHKAETNAFMYYKFAGSWVNLTSSLSDEFASSWKILDGLDIASAADYPDEFFISWEHKNVNQKDIYVGYPTFLSDSVYLPEATGNGKKYVISNDSGATITVVADVTGTVDTIDDAATYDLRVDESITVVDYDVDKWAII